MIETVDKPPFVIARADLSVRGNLIYSQTMRLLRRYAPRNDTFGHFVNSLMIKGIGIDLIEIDRFKKAIKRQGKKFLERVFTPAEIKYCLRHKRLSYQHFAARFAAKEAFLKAIGTGWGTKSSPQWTEIEVKALPRKPPAIILKGKALWHIRRLKVKRTRLTGRQVGQVHLSLTHTLNYAAAIIVIEG